MHVEVVASVRLVPVDVDRDGDADDELRRELGAGFLLVTPGVRPSGGDKEDQERLATPADAIRAGADAVIGGRALYEAPDPAEAAAAIAREIEGL